MRLRAGLRIDLPSDETLRQPGLLEKMFGLGARPSGEERVLGSTLRTIDSFVRAFAAMDITNVIALRVDDTLVFHDNEMVEDDLEQMGQALRANRHVLDEKFTEAHLVTELEEGGLHYVFDTSILGKVRKGDEEVLATISGRFLDLRPLAGEDAMAFRRRLLSLYSQQGTFDAACHRFEATAESLMEQIKVQTDSGKGKVEFVELALNVPNRVTLELLDRPFDECDLSFRRRAAKEGAPAFFDDPLSTYYEEPFAGYADLLAAHSLAAGAAPSIAAGTIVFGPNGEEQHRVGDGEPKIGVSNDALAHFSSEEAAKALDKGDLLSLSGTDQFLSVFE